MMEWVILTILGAIFASSRTPGSPSKALDTGSCEYRIAADDRTAAICRQGSRWRVAFGDKVSPVLYASLQGAIVVVIRELAPPGSDYGTVDVHVPGAHARMERAEDGKWSWTAEDSSGTSVSGTAPDSMSALREMYRATGDNTLGLL